METGNIEFLAVELILRVARHGIALPPMTISCEKLIVLTYWNALLARSLIIDAMVILLNSPEEQKRLSENHSMNRKCTYESHFRLRTTL